MATVVLRVFGSVEKKMNELVATLCSESILTSETDMWNETSINHVTNEYDPNLISLKWVKFEGSHYDDINTCENSTPLQSPTRELPCGEGMWQKAS